MLQCCNNSRHRQNPLHSVGVAIFYCSGRCCLPINYHGISQLVELSNGYVCACKISLASYILTDVIPLLRDNGKHHCSAKVIGTYLSPLKMARSHVIMIGW